MRHGISVENLSFSYESGGSLILQGLDMEAPAGEFVCILGQSGCGKSTLLRLLAGLDKPVSGRILVDGEVIAGAQLDRSVVFQDYGLFPWKTAGDNILLALRQKYPDKSNRELKNIALYMLDKVGLPETVFKKYPKELSGGMKQRCAIARSFAVDPPILLMDEPFGALDAVTRAKLQDLVLELWRKDDIRKTVFFVTHDVDEAILLGNRLFVLGQSPSKVIYTTVIRPEDKPDRESIYSSQSILQLRAELISHIHKDMRNRL